MDDLFRVGAMDEPPASRTVPETMRKQIVADAPAIAPMSDEPWVDLEAHARVQLTSEDSAYPIESALRQEPGKGWRAAHSGPQTIWLRFDRPQPVRHICLRFEAAEPRTQEFVLVSSNDGGVSYRDVVRQQYNFSTRSPREEENYFVHLTGVTDLKLTIVPDISGGDARATLQSLRIR
jgi:hypothetical protein